MQGSSILTSHSINKQHSQKPKLACGTNISVALRDIDIALHGTKPSRWTRVCVCIVRAERTVVARCEQGVNERVNEHEHLGRGLSTRQTSALVIRSDLHRTG